LNIWPFLKDINKMIKTATKLATLASSARIFMCRPEFFEVSYKINPWMVPDEWSHDKSRFEEQSKGGWVELYHKLTELGASVELVDPVPGLPDLVFTANAAVVMDGKILLATFRHPERQGEEKVYKAFFENLIRRGLCHELIEMPSGVVLEGAGDCVWDPVRQMFWAGYGPRSSKAAGKVVEETFGLPVESLELVNPRYYHMDTALVPLSGGEVVYYPGAFSTEGRATIRRIIGDENLIAVGDADAEILAVNLVCLGKNIVLSNCSREMEAALNNRGYTVHKVPISSFGKSGGSAFCLTLRLDRVSQGESQPALRVSNG
jgi:N-dimethylarginine dimethylaminohydrolase